MILEELNAITVNPTNYEEAIEEGWEKVN